MMKQKLMRAMLERDAGKPPMSGRVEIDDAYLDDAYLDDAYLGGARSGGKRGRGAAGKTPFVAAVETTADRRPRRLKRVPVKGFRKAEIEKLAKAGFAAGTNVVSDGLACWQAVTRAGCDHFPMRTGSGRQAARWKPFNWVNTTLGNIKTALAGTYHHVSPKTCPCLPRQLRLALQSALSARYAHRAFGMGRRAVSAEAVSVHHCRMTIADNQESFVSPN